MTDSEALELVSYMIGAFAIGWGVGFLTVSFTKALERI